MSGQMSGGPGAAGGINHQPSPALSLVLTFTLPPGWLLDTLYNHDRTSSNLWAARLYLADPDYTYTGFGFGPTPQSAIDAALRTDTITPAEPVTPTFVDLRAVLGLNQPAIKRRF